MNWLDWAIIIYVVWSGIRGAREGLVIGLSRMAAMLLGWWGAFHYFRALSVYLDEKLYASSKIMSLIELPAAPPGIPEVLYKAPGELLLRAASTSLLNIISFFILLFFIYTAVLFAGVIISRAANFLQAGVINHSGGLLLGMARGVLTALAVLAAALIIQVPLVQVMGKGQWLAQALQGSAAAGYFSSAVAQLNIDFTTMFLRGLL